MALTIGYVNTATSPVTGARDGIVPEPINFNADWRVVSEANGEVILTNISAPIDQPETLRLSYAEVADIFKGTKVTPPEISQTAKAGASILAQMTGVGLDASGQKFPYSTHLVLKVPIGTEVSAANIEQMLERLLGSLYETKAVNPENRINSLIRGALTPIDL